MAQGDWRGCVGAVGEDLGGEIQQWVQMEIERVCGNLVEEKLHSTFRKERRHQVRTEFTVCILTLKTTRKSQASSSSVLKLTIKMVMSRNK